MPCQGTRCPAPNRRDAKEFFMSRILTAYSAEELEQLADDDKKFLIEEDGKVFYDPSPLLRTLENQRKAEREAKAEADKVKAQIEALKNESEKVAKKEEPKSNDELLELQKALKAMQDQMTHERTQNAKLKMQQIVIQAAELAGMRSECVKLFDERIAQDDKGTFILDVDNTPKIDPLTGERISVEDFFKQELKTKPWAAKDMGSGASFEGSGIRGQINKVQTSKTQEKEIRKGYQEAVLNGNTNAMQKFRMKAIQAGINL